jgi:hypothetical protein
MSPKGIEQFLMRLPLYGHKTVGREVQKKFWNDIFPIAMTSEKHNTPPFSSPARPLYDP